MIRLKYKSWKDINVDTFEKLNKIKVDDEFSANIELLSILCDCSTEEIENLSTKEFNRLLRKTSFLLSMPKVFVKDVYKINGKKYTLLSKIADMNVSQYIDFQTYYKKGNDTKNILSVLLIPKGKKYGQYNLDEVKEDIGKYLNIVDAYSICFFFTLLFQSLTKGIGIYSVFQMKKMMKKEKKNK